MSVTAQKSPSVSLARRVAFEVLEMVENGAYASDSLRDQARELTSRDAGLASQIVFGCLRHQSQLDYLIFSYSGQRADRLDFPVRLALRTGIFQLRYLERVPKHAAVHEAVEWVKARKRAATGLVNAVLRKVSRGPVPWPDQATQLSCPSWLLERWSEHFGAERAEKIAQAALREPTPHIRVAPGRELPAGLELEATDVSGAYRLLSPAPPTLRLHDIGSQTIIPHLGIGPGDRLLDLCAAPGNKILQALEAGPGLVVACDISPKRLGDVTAAAVSRVLLDATQELPFSRRFERVLLDAPCSGTGTLGRNPEIKWRLQEADLARFAAKQKALLRQALAASAPGGTLVYATCSLEREENEQVVAEVLAERAAGFVCVREAWRLPGREEGDGFYAAVLRGR